MFDFVTLCWSSVKLGLHQGTSVGVTSGCTARGFSPNLTLRPKSPKSFLCGDLSGIYGIYVSDVDGLMVDMDVIIYMGALLLWLPYMMHCRTPVYSIVNINNTGNRNGLKLRSEVS